MASLEAKFGKVLRELRISKGLSQEALGTDAGLDRTYISLLERGLRQPTIRTLFNLSNALGVAPSSIIKSLE